MNNEGKSISCPIIKAPSIVSTDADTTRPNESPVVPINSSKKLRSIIEFQLASSIMNRIE